MGGDLSKGALKGNIVTCPKHKAKFDTITGKVISGPKVFFMHPKIKDEPFYMVKGEGEGNIRNKFEWKESFQHHCQPEEETRF